MEMASRRREQEVWQACDDLWALYGNIGSITGDAIRERLLVLGKSRGSPNEIYKYRKTWTMSRGVGQEVAMQNPAESDPITRAVRMVHEKIQSETQEEIEKLQLKFNEELLAKDEEIGQCKKDMLALMNEFSSLQQEYSLLGQNNKELLEQHAVEVEIRKAIEKDLSLLKSLHAQALHSHEQVMAEFYKNQSYTLEQIKTAFSSTELSLKMNIAEIEKEKKQLGQEYSEQLNVIRIEKYNKEIIIKDLENKNSHLNDTLLFSQQKIAELESKFKTVLEDVLMWRNNTEMLQMQLERTQSELCLSSSKLEFLSREILKRDVIIARLRVLLAHRGSTHGPARERKASRASSNSRTNQTETTVSYSSQQ